MSAAFTPGSNCVLRGGCWFFAPLLARVAHRVNYAPDYRDDILGFRLVRRVS